jgi:DMSO/TMAO reductase YedYZ molybdopterin-dependent catalytic subunit
MPRRGVLREAAPRQDGSAAPRQDGAGGVALPPGQRVTAHLPVVASSPATAIRRRNWELVLTAEQGRTRRWDWPALRALPSETISVDLHCVAGWSVLASTWEATSVHHLFAGLQTSARYVVVQSAGDYTANLPLEDLLEMPTWLAFGHEGQPLAAERGGPVRLLVPHLYLWKSVKWIRGLTLCVDDRPGTRERAGYHNYGDPWREQRTRDGRPLQPTRTDRREALP